MGPCCARIGGEARGACYGAGVDKVKCVEPPPEVVADYEERIPPSGAVCVVDPYTPPEQRTDALAKHALEVARDPRIVSLAQRVGGPVLDDPRRVLQRLLDGLHELVEYRDDAGANEVWQSVVYTLTNQRGTERSPVTGRLKGTGDCEEMATVLLTLALALGFTGRLHWQDNPPGAPRNHIYAEVLLEGRWLPLEATIPGAQVGESPSEAVRRLGWKQRITGSSGQPMPDPLVVPADALAKVVIEGAPQGVRFLLQPESDPMMVNGRYLRGTPPEVSTVRGRYLLSESSARPLRVFPAVLDLEPGLVVRVQYAGLRTLEQLRAGEVGPLAVTRELDQSACVLPSARTACDVIEGKPGAWLRVARDVLLRGTVIGAGVAVHDVVQGERSVRKIAGRALAGSVATEVAVLAHTLARRIGAGR